MPNIVNRVLMHLLILTGCLLVAHPGQGAPRERLALVVGNAGYDVAQLKNPVRDATAMASELRQLGFSVDLLTDANQREMEGAIRRFTRRLQPNSVSLFYYAGHAVEVGGENYLIPLGAAIESETDVRYDGVEVGRVLDGMARAENGLNLVILDACRNNPYASGFRGLSRGLARMSPASGSLVLYATEPGQVASDGDGDHGLFTEHLLSALAVPGRTPEAIFKQTARSVSEATGGVQTPWMEGVILGDFYFKPDRSAAGAAESSAVPSAPAQPSRPMHLDQDALTCELLRKEGNRAMLAAYLQQFPDGQCSGYARVRLAALDASPPAMPRVQQPANVVGGQYAEPNPPRPVPSLGFADMKALSPGWTTIDDPAYRFRLPLSLFQEPVRRGDDTVYVSRDGRTRATVSEWFAPDDPPALSFSKAKRARQHTDLTYKRMKDDWFVLSGYDGAEIYYEKTLLGANSRRYRIEFVYPTDQRKFWDGIVAEAAKSFRRR